MKSAKWTSVMYIYTNIYYKQNIKIIYYGLWFAYYIYFILCLSFFSTLSIASIINIHTYVSGQRRSYTEFSKFPLTLNLCKAQKCIMFL